MLLFPDTLKQHFSSSLQLKTISALRGSSLNSCRQRRHTCRVPTQIIVRAAVRIVLDRHYRNTHEENNKLMQVPTYVYLTVLNTDARSRSTCKTSGNSVLGMRVFRPYVGCTGLDDRQEHKKYAGAPADGRRTRSRRSARETPQ